jgi:hypothetical protein
MNLRDNNNTMEEYKYLLNEKTQRIMEHRNEISNLEEAERKGNQIHKISNKEVISNIFDDIYRDTFDIFLVNYSIGKDVSKLVEDYINIVQAMLDTKKAALYRTLPFVLSIGVLLDKNNKFFPKLAELVKTSMENTKEKWYEKHLKDYFIDFLINYKIPEWQRINQKAQWKPYQTFVEIELLINSNRKEEAVLLLKKYLQRQWLPANNDNSRGKSYYCGYWSFESGAVVKIFGLDDTILKGLNYYPYDMVHWK